MLEHKKPPFIPPPVVNTLYTPSHNQYVYFQPFESTLDFTVTAASDVHILFAGKDIERELVICTAGSTTSEVRTSAAGSPLVSTETLRLKPTGSSISIVWDAAMRIFTVTVDGTSWAATLPAGAKMNPFSKVSFSTGGGVVGTFVLQSDPMGADYGYSDFSLPKPIIKKEKKKEPVPTAAPIVKEDKQPAVEEQSAAQVEEEQPAASVEEQPAASVEEQPAASVEEQPAASVEEQPAASVEEQPAASVEEQPVEEEETEEKKPVRKTRGRKKKAI